jgi:hypothetical protein
VTLVSKKKLKNLDSSFVKIKINQTVDCVGGLVLVSKKTEKTM